MSILIRKEGMLSTIQDLGRIGYREFGVNVTGPMDSLAVRAINILLDNSENSPVIEMHFPADTIEFKSDTNFAIGGADFDPRLNKIAIDNARVCSALSGDVLSFHAKHSGNRAYLAVRGGFCADEWIGSQSTNLKARIGGWHGRRLRSGDRIGFGQYNIN